MQIIIDGNPISAETGDMILDAAHRAGIDIPALCRLPELRPPSTSCLVCLVKLNEKFVPSCAVPEPTTLAAVGLGLAGLGLARRRRKK